MVPAYVIQQEQEIRRGGSIPGHVVIHRDREIADLDAVKNHDIYFTQRTDGLGRLGLSTLHKTTVALHILAYALHADATDEFIKIGESTAIQCMQRFCRAVVEVFSEQYLRSPNSSDIIRLLYVGEQRGFPGMLGSLDCMHWKWKNYLTAWACQYAGRSGSPTIILETVADYDLWICHAYFGIAPPAHYTIGEKEYDMGYYLADGIYPKWSTIVQTIHDPRGPKKKYFAMKQESCRKDVECVFGVLESRFAIVASLARAWKKHHLYDIMTSCIIMNNMIIEDERDLSASIEDMRKAPTPDVEMATDEHIRFQEFLKRYKKIKDKNAHYALRNALIDHLWEKYSSNEN